MSSCCTLAVTSSEGQGCLIDLYRRLHQRQDGIKASIGRTAGQRAGAWSHGQRLQARPYAAVQSRKLPGMLVS